MRKRTCNQKTTPSCVAPSQAHSPTPTRPFTCPTTRISSKSSTNGLQHAKLVSNMPLTKLEHYLVLTQDIDATRDFYVDVLGMENGFRPPLGFPGHWVYIGDIPVIHIAEWATYTARQKARNAFVTSPAEGTGPVDHIAFGAEDYEGTLHRIRQ